VNHLYVLRTSVQHSSYCFVCECNLLWHDNAGCLYKKLSCRHLTLWYMHSTDVSMSSVHVRSVYCMINCRRSSIEPSYHSTCDYQRAVAKKAEKSAKFRVLHKVPDGSTLKNFRTTQIVCQKQLDPYSRFDRTLICDRHTDRHRTTAYISR